MNNNIENSNQQLNLEQLKPDIYFLNLSGWVLIIIGILCGLFSLGTFASLVFASEDEFMIGIMQLIFASVSSLVYIISGIGVLKRSKSAWLFVIPLIILWILVIYLVLKKVINVEYIGFTTVLSLFNLLIFLALFKFRSLFK